MSQDIHDEEYRPQDIRVHVDELADRTDTLRRLGEEQDVPAVERNAKRIAAIVDVLERSLPPETTDD